MTDYTPANNGAGPMWCYGSTVIATLGDDVFLSTIETGRDVPLLCNTRWRLWRRFADGWKLAQSESGYRQREPCPIAVLPGGRVFLSVNPSQEPPGVKYGRCQPTILEFNAGTPDAPPKSHLPAWSPDSHFTDHSYRGFAADGKNGDLLLLNVHAGTGEQYVSYCDREGKWHAKGKIAFPIRACYPQVALHSRSAHVMAIGDIVEPVEQWRQLKFEKLKNKWDYVFRRLFYTFTPDITKQDFGEIIEVDTVESTCGHITNLDLHVDASGTAHLLYLKRPFQYEFIRDKYFPGKPMTASLQYMALKNGQVLFNRVVAKIPEGEQGVEPSFGRFHALADGSLVVIFAGTKISDGKREFGNFVAPVPTDETMLKPVLIPLEHPFRNFFTNTPRAGSQPSNTAHLFGLANDNPNLRYAGIKITNMR